VTVSVLFAEKQERRNGTGSDVVYGIIFRSQTFRLQQIEHRMDYIKSSSLTWYSLALHDIIFLEF